MAGLRNIGWGKGLAIAGGSLAALILALALVWQTGVLDRSALWAAGAASGYRIDCKKLDGDLLDSFTCRDLTLSDAKGVFLHADEFAADWRVLSFVSNTAALDVVSVRGATLSRLPKSDTPSDPNADFLPGINIRIGKLTVSHLVMPPQNGRTLCMNATAQGYIGPSGFDADLRAARCEPGSGQTIFTGRYDKKTRALTLNAKGSDDGALAAFFTGEETVGATSLTLSGAGTLDAFDGRLTFVAANLGRIAFTFNASATPATRIDGQFTLSPKIAPDWAPDTQGTIAGEIARTKDGGVAVRDAQISWGGLNAVLNVTQNGAGALSGQVALNARQHFAMAGVSADVLSLQANLSGTAEQPVADGQLRATNLISGGAGAGSIASTFNAQMDRDAGTLAVALRGRADDPILPQIARSLTGNAVNFAGRLTQNSADHDASLQLNIDGAALNLNAAASMQSGKGSGVVNVTIPDTAKANAGFTGAIKARFDMTRITQDGAVDGTLHVTGSSISPTGWGQVLGMAPALTAKVQAQDGSYALTNLVLTSAGLSVKGDMALSKNGTLIGDLRSTQGDAGKFAAVAGVPLAGNFAIEAHASASGDVPTFVFKLNSERLGIAGNVIEKPALVVTAEQTKNDWDAKLSLSAGTPGGALNFAANGGTTKSGWRFHVTKGVLGTAKMDGGLTGQNKRLSGKLSLSGNLLTPLGALIGADLHGQGAIILRGDSHGLALDADLKKVSGGSLVSADIKANITAPSLDGPFAISASVKDGNNNLAAKASVTTGKTTQITLSQLSGKWAAEKFALTAPTHLVLAGGRYNLSDASFAIGNGRLRISGKGDASHLNAALNLRAMPASLAAELAGLGKATGTISLDVEADLAPGKTKATIALSAKDLLFTAAGKNASPADLDIRGNWNGKTFVTNGTIKGLGEKPVTLDAQLPVIRRNNAVLPVLASSGPVRVKLRANVQAGRIVGALPLAEHRVSGDFYAVLDVSGDIAHPVIDGTASVKSGTYENLETGTKLVKLNANLRATGSNHADVTLEATDGSSGRVALKGDFSLGAPYGEHKRRVFGEAKLDLHDAYVLRQDGLKASVSGNLTVSLPHDAKASITGKFRTDEVRLDLAARMPPDIPQIQVTEINGGQIRVAKPVSPSPYSYAKLDISVEMPNRVFVSGKGLDSEWRGQASVSGTLGEPQFDAALNLARGQLELVGKTFKLDEGKVALDRNAKGGATVHITGAYTNTDLTVNVSVDGDAADPKITWSSSPSLPKDEILSRMFFGKSSPKLTAVEAFQLAQLTGQLDFLGGGGGGILSFARGLTGLDVLRFDSPAGGNGGTALTVGKNLTDRIYVGATKGTGADQGSAQIEVRITPRISIDAEAGVDSSGAAGVSWKWDY